MPSRLEEALTSIDNKAGTLGAATIANSAPVNIASDQTVPISAASLPLPTGAATQTTLASIDAGIPAALGQTTMAGSMPVVMASNQSVLDVAESKPSTSSVTSVASSTSNVTLLASNSSRRGASIYNDSTQTLYVKLGATASSTSFTVKMASEAFYEVPFPVYTGVIDGIWAVANGNARITELT